MNADIKLKTVAQFEQYVCDHIFETPDAYLEIVRAAEGNPRDFLSLLAQCCSIASQRTAPLSEKDCVRIAVSHFITAKQPNVSEEAGGKLYKELFEKVVKNKQKLFLLSSAKAERDGRIQQLWHYRFIHLVAPSYMVLDESGTPKDYSVFSMD